MPHCEGSGLYGPLVHVASSRVAMGNQAAAEIGDEIRACLRKQAGARMVFAAAPSQAEMLAALCLERAINWARVTAFHMDEYLGLAADSPHRFANWLRRAIFDLLPLGLVHLIEPGGNPERTAEDYAAKLSEAPIDIVCCGIGVNGHLAFNDPPGDFNDPRTMKIVNLDAQCRQQQVDDQCFAVLSEVPAQALTVTIPALFSGHAIFCTVPGSFKRDAVRRTLLGPIDPSCPASILRRHPRCTMYLDQDSASGLPLHAEPR